MYVRINTHAQTIMRVYWHSYAYIRAYASSWKPNTCIYAYKRINTQNRSHRGFFDYSGIPTHIYPRMIVHGAQIGVYTHIYA